MRIWQARVTFVVLFFLLQFITANCQLTGFGPHCISHVLGYLFLEDQA
jgi:DNA-binding transcriptional regulator of glucitol operon